MYRFDVRGISKEEASDMIWRYHYSNTLPKLNKYFLGFFSAGQARQNLRLGKDKMAFIQYLRFDGENLALPDSYEVQMKDVEADSGGETEVGTTQRNVVKLGVISIPVSFSVSVVWLGKLTAYKQKEKIRVDYFDTQTLAAKNTEMYVDGFNAVMVKDSSKKGLWTVSFTLKEF